MEGIFQRDINLLLVVRNFLEGQFFWWIRIFQRDINLLLVVRNFLAAIFWWIGIFQRIF